MNEAIEIGETYQFNGFVPALELLLSDPNIAKISRIQMNVTSINLTEGTITGFVGCIVECFARCSYSQRNPYGKHEVIYATSVPLPIDPNQIGPKETSERINFLHS